MSDCVLHGLMVLKVWVKVALKSAQDQCDVSSVSDLNDSTESTTAHPIESRDTWHWLVVVVVVVVVVVIVIVADVY